MNEPQEEAGRAFAGRKAVLASCTAAVMAMCGGSSPVMGDGICAKSTVYTGVSVVCTLSSDASSIDLSTVLSEAQAIKSSITSSTQMVITAFGGAGANGDGDGQQTGGVLGTGGIARMGTTLDTFRSTYGTTTIYYYLGAQGSDEHEGGKGGAATIVSIADLSSTKATTANVLLIAGGGGGGSAANMGQNGHRGGSGGTAVSAIGASATGAGQEGGSGGGDNGGAGAGGADGKGGSGGAASKFDKDEAGKSGSDGLGGQGGPVHLEHGPSTSTGWLNVSGVPSGIGSNGQGGEGEYRGGGSSSSMHGEGGGGGGGYGGGGGGGGGGEGYEGGGGGGGGSYAAASTASSGLNVTDPGDNKAGNVLIAFPD
jgi:hypothetical protein